MCSASPAVNPARRAVKQRQAGRLQVALRAGFTALLASFAVLALFTAPYWAAQTNFPGHEHAEHAPAHTHALAAVVGFALLVVTGVAAIVSRGPGWPRAQPPTEWPRRTPPTRSHGSRAPPLAGFLIDVSRN